MSPDEATTHPGWRRWFSGRLLTIAKIATAVGLLSSVPVMVRIGPYSLAVFFGIAQPALFVGLVSYAAAVLADLRGRGVL